MPVQQERELRHAFSIVPPDHQQQFRLLELSPDVLNLITANDPPSLQLKSLERLPGHSSDSNAVLCTPNQTFTLRQVNHSNSVFVTKSAESQIGEAGTHGQPALEAIAQSTFTLELTSITDVPAAAYLKDALPVYRAGGLDDHSRPHLSKSQHFSNIPLDEAQCEQAWRELACFEMHDRAASFVPTPSSRNGAWDAMLIQAVAEGIDLTSEITSSHVHLLTSLDGTEWPMELCQAILDSMNSNNAEGVWHLDGNECARLNGIALLQQHASGSACTAANFHEKWADSLPEKWRTRADLGLLKGSYKHTTTTLASILYVDKMAEEVNAVREAAGSNTKTGTKRKWHDKFRAAKKAN